MTFMSVSFSPHRRTGGRDPGARDRHRFSCISIPPASWSKSAAYRSMNPLSLRKSGFRRIALAAFVTRPQAERSNRRRRSIRHPGLRRDGAAQASGPSGPSSGCTCLRTTCCRTALRNRRPFAPDSGARGRIIDIAPLFR